MLMTQTCKFIRNTVQKSAFLSYLIDLAYHQLQATEASTVPYAARKQCLLKTQNRWSKLEWAVKHEVECPHTARRQSQGGQLDVRIQNDHSKLYHGS